ncbi:hypothetical protein [uncultured Draconibacterium sp.]|uniref:hypothetical protein n=1 Tax=uncultured Draconibacterium sp. TaxID=1573823 RepID=UPI003217A880
MTIQINDRIYLDGKLYELLSTPLKAFFESHPEIQEFSGTASNCERGYVASWRLRNNVLYLTGFQPFESTVYVDRTQVLSGTRMLADWYTGMLRIPVGPVVHRFSDGHALHEKEMHLYIENGILQNHEVKYNQRIPRDKKDNISH